VLTGCKYISLAEFQKTNCKKMVELSRPGHTKRKHWPLRKRNASLLSGIRSF
jgi:hypothetical protein